MFWWDVIIRRVLYFHLVDDCWFRWEACYVVVRTECSSRKTVRNIPSSSNCNICDGGLASLNVSWSNAYNGHNLYELKIEKKKIRIQMWIYIGVR